MNRFFVFIVSLFCFFRLDYSYCETKDFFVITIPKSGTHLIDRLIILMTGKHQKHTCLMEKGRIGPFKFPGIDPNCHISKKSIENHFLFCKRNNKYCLSHTNFSKPLAIFYDEHSEYQPIIQIRDLRDVCVSLTAVYEMESYRKGIEHELGSYATFDDKLLYIIQLCDNTPSKILSVLKYSKEALFWMNDPNVIVSKFEDLVGLQGGGDKEKQIELIQKIADSINFKLDKDHLEEIIENLFGSTWTFRKGQIGQWKTAFKEEHKMAFKESQLGDLLIQMGYEKDNNW